MNKKPYMQIKAEKSVGTPVTPTRFIRKKIIFRHRFWDKNRLATAVAILFAIAAYFTNHYIIHPEVKEIQPVQTYTPWTTSGRVPKETNNNFRELTDQEKAYLSE